MEGGGTQDVRFLISTVPGDTEERPDVTKMA